MVLTALLLKSVRLSLVLFGMLTMQFTELFAAFQSFVPKMKCLTYLNLKGLTNVTDKSISGLADLEHLKHLNLKRCTGLTDDCGKTLRNIKLERLDMSYTLVCYCCCLYQLLED